MKIDKNIPLPVPRIPPLPFDKLGIGHCITVPFETETDKRAIRKRMSRFQDKNFPVHLGWITLDETTVRIQRLTDYKK